VTKKISQLQEFLGEAGGEMVVKPLDGHGGEGIFYVREGDRNANVILEAITKFGTEYVMAQKFIEEVADGGLAREEGGQGLGGLVHGRFSVYRVVSGPLSG
ncbi:MAG: hypothetical protein AAGK32_01360, partial [Actinomycetota bacterium]